MVNVFPPVFVKVPVCIKGLKVPLINALIVCECATQKATIASGFLLCGETRTRNEYHCPFALHYYRDCTRVSPLRNYTLWTFIRISWKWG